MLLPAHPLPRAHFQRNVDWEGQVTPFAQNKEEKYTSGLFTGVEREPFHCNLSPAFSGLNEGKQALDPKLCEGLHEGCASLSPQVNGRLSSLTRTQNPGAHTGISATQEMPLGAHEERFLQLIQIYPSRLVTCNITYYRSCSLMCTLIVSSLLLVRFA